MDIAAIDIAIIGAGPAGLTAAIYAARAGYQTVIFESAVPGGQVISTDTVDNFPGMKGIAGYEIIDKMLEHVKSYGIEIINEPVTAIDITGKNIVTSQNTYKTKTIIIAAGAKRRKLEVEGETEFLGRGVSYCAICDGNFYRKKDVAVVGGGYTAVEDAAYLARICNKVYIIHRRDDFRAKGIEVDHLKSLPNVELVMNSAVTAITGEAKVSAINVNNLVSGENTTINVSGIFITVGTIPASEFIPPEIKCNDDNYIITDENMMTNISGIFAAGDIRQSPLKQIITAASDGATAASKAVNYIEDRIKI
jgi:thioredoxin-disulfide reductase